MEIVLLDQTRVSVYASVLGLALGALYDLFLFFPQVFGKKVLEPVFDVLYCITFMGGFIALVPLRAGGRIRWYIPGGIILGLILYFCGFSDYVRMVLSFAERGVRAVGRVMKKLFDWLATLFEPPRGC